ncbi:unnamed protein product [Brassica napus]|uniref:FAE domain-containing protein n=3 Tax=Brassica TaxID=3705 RepID=A0A0D3AP00_BRAOL|nr:unnamed protein product [Brassica napus]
MPQGPMPEFSTSVKLKYVKLGYQYLVNHFLSLLLIPIMAIITVELLQMGPEEILNVWKSLHFDLAQVLCSSFVVIFISTVYFMSKPQTCLPPAIHYIPPTPTMDEARSEAQMVIFSAMDDLFKKTGIMPKDIDILIVNFSLFSPTPSLSAMVINKYKLRSNIKSFNLSGIGCNAGLISVELARDLLQVHPNSNAIIISTEIITPNHYKGNGRAIMLPNCLFRMGSVAILMSNRRSDRWRAKYKLSHLVRTHCVADDKSYYCVYD